MTLIIIVLKLILKSKENFSYNLLIALIFSE